MQSGGNRVGLLNCGLSAHFSPETRKDMQSIDTLIDARWVVPVEPAGTVLEHHSVAIHNGLIAAVLPTPEAHVRYAAAAHVVLPDHVLIPGLINLHTHAAMTLMRGMADDLPLMDWLHDHIWPAEAKHVSAEFVRAGTELACAEMLRGGITCMNEMYFFPEAAAQAALTAGMRASLGMVVIDFPTAYASDPDDYLAKGLALRDSLRHEPLLSFCLAPHAPYTVGDASFEKIVRYAEELGLPVHMHVHETADEIAGEFAKTGMRPLARLKKLGLVGPQLIAVHAVHLTPEEIELLAHHGASVAHCPSSNLKLASGIAPVAQLLTAGVNVGLGTDGAASNNRLDMFAEMRLAALLAKGASGDARAMPAHTALQAATLNGARALGLEAKIGSLVAGKAADITAVNLGSPQLQPVYDPVSHLIYAAGRENVTDVWVGGNHVVNALQFARLDAPSLESSARLWQNRLRNQD
ncbi:MAG: N-ethylammeline chlorohydrolase [Betaproteobacteria bacterium]|nr:N-ethylammeline chlorohydrolase [Betaproteobacteria bacterium]